MERGRVALYLQLREKPFDLVRRRGSGTKCIEKEFAPPNQAGKNINYTPKGYKDNVQESRKKNCQKTNYIEAYLSPHPQPQNKLDCP